MQLSVVRFTKGSFIVIEGTPNTGRFFIIQSGHVSCHRTNDSAGEGDRYFGPGDFIGVVSCMSGHSQIETSVAETDVVTICINIQQYPELIKNNSPVAMKVIRTFARRMREQNDVLTMLTLDNVADASSEHLYDVASYYDSINELSAAIFAYYQCIKHCPHGKYVEVCRQKISLLKSRTHAVYFEPTSELVRKYPKGTMIFAESQNGAEMFVIQEGSVRISKVVDGNEVTLARLGKTDVFGEMALLEDKPRSASAIAHEDCVLMVINKSNFDQIVKTQPGLVARLTGMLANRIWAMYRKFDNANLVSPHHKMLDMLAIQIEQAMPNVDINVQLQTQYTLQDLVTMCGIPQDEQEGAINSMLMEHRIKIVDDKIFVPNCLEVIKQAAFNMKQNRDRLQLAKLNSGGKE